MARASTRQIEVEPDNLSQARRELEDEELGVDQIKNVMSAMQAVNNEDPLTVSIALSTGAGKWNIVDTWRGQVKTFDVDALIEDVKNEHGNGEYKFVMRHNGKIIKQASVGIGNPKRTNNPLVSGGMDKEILPLLLNQMNTSKTDSMQMMQMMMQQSQASSDRQMTMMMGMMTAMMGGKDKTSEVMAALGPFMQRPDTGGSLKDSVETIAAIKTLFANDGASTEEGIMGLVKAGLPMLGDLARTGADALANRRQPPPGPVEQLSSTLAPPSAPQIEAPVAEGVNPMLPPQLALIRDDILFMFGRAYDPELAADALYDRLTKNGVTADDIAPIISALQSVGDQWLEHLAALGIDLRTNPVWASAVIGHLVGAFSQDGAEGDVAAGEGGGEGDT